MILTKTETGLFAFAVALITLALYQLWLPVNYHQEQNILGELGFLENSAKLKVSGDLVWRDARKGDPVSQGSSVFTGERAQAVVSMNSGSSIQLGANTLIRINETLQLENGLVHTTIGTRPLELNISGVNYRLAGEGTRLQLTQSDQATTLSVVEGELKVETKNQIFEIKKDQGLEVGVQGSKKVVFDVALVAPKMASTFWVREQKLVSFEWQSLAPARLEVSRDLKFSDILFSQVISSQSHALNLSAGAYYWRVSDSDKLSMIGHFSILQEKPITLIQPLDGAVIELADQGKAFSQLLQWSDTKVENYELLIEQDGKQKVIELQQTDFSLKVSESGLIRWKVKPQDEQRPEALESDWSSFNVIQTKILAAPVWAQESIELSKSREDRTPDIIFESSGIEHEWIVERQGEVLHTTRQVKREISFPYQDLAGEYELKVRSFNRYGEATPWSSPLKVKWTPFQEREPMRGQEIKLDRPDQKVNFQWEGEGEHYFELSQDEAFSQIIITRKARLATEIVFPEIGTYFWRVRRLDGTYSPPKKVIVEPSPPLSAPQAPPELKKELKLEFKTEKKTSLWDLLIPRAYADDFQGSLIINLPMHEKAEGYKVEIYSESGLENLIFTHVTAKSEFEWPQARPGRFWYRYALIDAWGRQSEMSPASILNIIPGQISPPERAKLIRPIRAQVIEAVPEITFSWTASARTQNYVLKIAKDEKFESLLFDQILNENQKLVETSEFEKGEMYFWKVISRHQYAETSSNVGRFVFSHKPAETPVSENKEMTPKPLRPLARYDQAMLSWAPQSLTTKIDEKEFNAEISGTLLKSLQIDLRKYLTEAWGLDFKLNTQSGKVFNNQDYLSRQLSLAALYTKSTGASFYHFDLGVAQSIVSSYTLSTPESLSEKEISSLGALAKVEWEKRFERTDSLHTNLSFAMGDVSEIQMNLFYRRFFRPSFFAQAGILYQIHSVKTATGKNESVMTGLTLGAGLAF